MTNTLHKPILQYNSKKRKITSRIQNFSECYDLVQAASRAGNSSSLMHSRVTLPSSFRPSSSAVIDTTHLLQPAAIPSSRYFNNKGHSSVNEVNLQQAAGPSAPLAGQSTLTIPVQANDHLNVTSKSQEPSSQLANPHLGSKRWVWLPHSGELFRQIGIPRWKAKEVREHE